MADPKSGLNRKGRRGFRRDTQRKAFLCDLCEILCDLCGSKALLLRLLQIRTTLALLALLLAASLAPAQTNNIKARLENAAALIRDNRIVEAQQ